MTNLEHAFENAVFSIVRNETFDEWKEKDLNLNRLDIPAKYIWKLAYYSCYYLFNKHSFDELPKVKDSIEPKKSLDEIEFDYLVYVLKFNPSSFDFDKWKNSRRVYLCNFSASDMYEIVQMACFSTFNYDSFEDLKKRE